MKAYLISSESFRLINEELEKIIKNSTNVLKYDMNNVSMQDLITEAAYLGIDDEIKYIIAKNSSFFSSGKLKEEDSDLLLNYLENPNPSTIIIFTLNTKIDERKKITKIMKEKYQIINIAKLNEYEMNKKINLDLKKDGYKMDYEAINYLIKASLNNYDILYNEIEKIKLCFLEKKNLTLKDIKSISSISIEDNIFKLINAIMDKDKKRYFKLFNDLKILKEEPVALINLLAREYRHTYIIKNKLRNKEELQQILKLQNWQYEKYEKYAYNYSNIELKNKLKELYNLDLNIKKGKIEKYLGFTIFLLNV